MTAAVVAPPSMDGAYADVPEDVYHADVDSLSSSGARRLLPPSCPAIFKHERDEGRPPKAEFDFGHAAHKFVLGEGAEIISVDADDWRTKAAREVRDQAYADGKVPLLARDVAKARQMAEKVHQHPIAGPLFRSGQPEVSLYWTDKKTGVRLRARPDFVPDNGTSRLILADYKTSNSALPRAFAKSAADYGYHQQDPWYVDGAIATGLGGDDTAFVFVVQSKTPPFVVTVMELDPTAIALGRRLNRRAIDIYAECNRTGIWPGYGDHVHLINLPTWAEHQQEDILL